ncbi:MAG: hypothetical protein ABII01_03585 [Candidatus Woesearchaeota archaeon]
MNPNEAYQRLAEFELGWWQAHHRHDLEGLTENMARLYETQFQIPYERAVEAVRFRVEATQEHDIAERYEDQRDQPQADIHWARVKELLIEHFRILGRIKQVSADSE